MSIGPTSGIAAGAAGSPLAQTQSGEPERASQQSSAQQRRVESEKKAESASGVGETEGDHESSERDADGRRLWEQQPDESTAEDSAETAEKPAGPPDPNGESGGLLDLSG